MSIIDSNEQVDLLATQSLHYDRYDECQYSLARVRVNGKYGLICGRQMKAGTPHTTVILPPIYSTIELSKISSPKALYDKYAVFADGYKIGEVTLVLNSWVPVPG
jgi:hypothetical protein